MPGNKKIRFFPPFPVISTCGNCVITCQVESINWVKTGEISRESPEKLRSVFCFHNLSKLSPNLLRIHTGRKICGQSEASLSLSMLDTPEVLQVPASLMVMPVTKSHLNCPIERVYQQLRQCTSLAGPVPPIRTVYYHTGAAG